ncbi:MAG: hypothetical protein OEY67_07850 [Gammaproteobacteria bacterium]|nr:hypothetical protein [Gammaproteobacteria bacterium]
MSLYVTDDLGSYSQVSATINSVSLTHQNKDVQCVLFDSPQSFNFADLGVRHVLELLSVTSCEVSDYNRLTISLGRDVFLTNAGGTNYQCVFSSYKNEQGQPNVLSCDTNSCTVSLSGAINLLPNTHSEVALAQPWLLPPQILIKRKD